MWLPKEPMLENRDNLILIVFNFELFFRSFINLVYVLTQDDLLFHLRLPAVVQAIISECLDVSANAQLSRTENSLYGDERKVGDFLSTDCSRFAYRREGRCGRGLPFFK